MLALVQIKSEQSKGATQIQRGGTEEGWHNKIYFYFDNRIKNTYLWVYAVIGRPLQLPLLC